MTTAKELTYVAGHLHRTDDSAVKDVCDPEEPTVFRRTRRYSKAEEVMHEDDRPQQKGEERRFSSTEAPTVVTLPFIYAHSVEEAPDNLHMMAHLRQEEEKVHPRSANQLGNAGHKPLFGEGGFGDHSAKHWDWPLGERQCVDVHGDEKTFEAWLDFRPYEPNEVWAKVMCDELIVHCKSQDGKRELFRNYALPLSCDARTARFRIKDKHLLVITVDKTAPLKLAVASYDRKNRAKIVHAEIGRQHS